MKVSVEQIGKDCEEEVIVRCHDDRAKWVESVREAANGRIIICGYKDGMMMRVCLKDIFYFEVVDGASFIYTEKDIFESHEKLYEFENRIAGSSLFRCSKSMILNADKIDYIRPSFSGRFEAVLSNGEKVVVSRQYAEALKRIFITQEAGK